MAGKMALLAFPYFYNDELMSMQLSSVSPQLAEGDTVNKRKHPQTQLAKSQIVKGYTKAGHPS